MSGKWITSFFMAYVKSYAIEYVIQYDSACRSQR